MLCRPPTPSPSQVMECIKMSEDTTTSSSRIFVKILFQELCAYMGLPKLNERLKDMYVTVCVPLRACHSLNDKWDMADNDQRYFSVCVCSSRTLQPFFEGLFPRDNPRNTRFAINFFTSIGLGGLT